LYEQGADGRTRVTGLRLGKASEEQVVTADAYVAALDVPGAKRLIPQVRRGRAPQLLLLLVYV
jgi:zeta-carotene desaturase